MAKAKAFIETVSDMLWQVHNARREIEPCDIKVFVVGWLQSERTRDVATVELMRQVPWPRDTCDTFARAILAALVEEVKRG